jgi:hypothetical protein
MEDEQFEEMIYLAKTLKLGRNWGFRNAVYSLSMNACGYTALVAPAPPIIAVT